MSLTGTQISGKVLFNNQPVTSKRYMGVNLLNANKNSNNYGKISGSATLDTEGKYVFEKAPKDDYYINFITEDSTFSTQYYKSSTEQPVLNWKDASKVESRNNKIENLNISLAKTPYSEGKNTVSVIIDVSKCFNPYLWYFLNIECRLYEKNSNKLIAFAHPTEFNNFVYQATIPNVPPGQYKLIVEFPFVEQMDFPELNLGELTLTTPVNMNVDNDKLYRNVGDGLDKYEIGDLRIYPNPASDYIRLSGKFKQPDIIQIYSAEGKLVKNIPYFVSDKIFIKDLKEGIYFVRIDNFWGKFIKR